MIGPATPAGHRTSAGGATGAGAWVRAGALLVTAAGVVLALYLAHPIVSGYRLPIGPDGPVYTWLARHAAEVGFVDAPGGGPGVPALTLTVGRAFGLPPIDVVTLLGPVLAAVCGLAAAGLLEAALGRDPVRTAAAVILTGAFTAYLAGGWLANVTMVAVFLAAVAALTLSHRSWRAAAGGGALLVAAGLAHWLFLLIGLVVVGGMVVAHLGEVRLAVRSGTPVRDTTAARVGAAALAASGVVALALASLGGARIPGDTSQDGFLRRFGLKGLLLDRYRERFLGDLERAAIPVGLGVGFGAVAVGRPPRPSPPELRSLAAAGLTWAVATAAGIVLFAATGWGPPNRLLQFAFFLPVAAAVGVALLVRGRVAFAVVGVVAGAAFVVASMGGWHRQSPAFQAPELRTVEEASRALEPLPGGIPVLVLVDTDQPAAAYHVTRMGNVIRMGIQPERIDDVHVVVGHPDDLLARRPTRTGDLEHDAISVAYLREAEPLLDRAVVLVLRPFNPDGYDGAAQLGTEIAPGVAILSGPRPGADPGLEDDAVTEGGLSPGALVSLAAASLIALAAAGGGWARWALPRAGAAAVVASAPSAGIAVAILGAFAADRFGLRPGELGSAAAVVSLAALGYFLAVRTARADR